MKKQIAVILTALLAISCVGCSSGGGASSAAANAAPSSSQTVSNAPAESKPESKAESKAQSDKGKIGDYDVAIESARLSKDYAGKKVVIVKFKFMNNSDKAASFGASLIGKAFQDGVELENATVTDDKEYNANDFLKEIKKGASLEVECPYNLSNEKSEVEVEVTPIISLDDSEKVTKNFDISTLK